MQVILHLAVGGMYYNFVSSLGGLEGDTLERSRVGQLYEHRDDGIVTDLSHYMSSCGTTA